MTLDTSANNFERGSKDIFKLSFIDIGELQYVIVKKDNRTLGMGGDWHLQSAEVFHPGGSGARAWGPNGAREFNGLLLCVCDVGARGSASA